MAVKKKPTNLKRKAVGIWILILSLFISELLIYTWSRVQCVNIGYEINRASKERTALKALTKKIQIELARLKSPERISKIAKERLNLITPTPSQVIVVQ